MWSSFPLVVERGIGENQAPARSIRHFIKHIPVRRRTRKFGKAISVQIDAAKGRERSDDLRDFGVRGRPGHGFNELEHGISLNNEETKAALFELAVQQGWVPMVDGTVFGVALQIISGEGRRAGEIHGM